MVGVGTEESVLVVKGTELREDEGNVWVEVMHWTRVLIVCLGEIERGWKKGLKRGSLF